MQTTFTPFLTLLNSCLCVNVLRFIMPKSAKNAKKKKS